MADMARHNATLDGLRGVAALAVVWLHMTEQTRLGSMPYRAHLAVDFFFVLSGFVVAKAYEQKLLGRLSFLGFARIRLIRLYPLIFLGMLIGGIAKLAAFYGFGAARSGIPVASEVWEALLFGLVLLPHGGMYGGKQDLFPLDGPVWSLMFEVLSNVFYALFIRALRNSTLIVVLISSATGLICASYVTGSLDGGNTETTLWIGLMRVAFSFFAGVLLYRLFESGRLNGLPRIPAWLLVIALVLSFLPGPESWGWLYELAAVFFIYPAIVAVGAFDNIAPRMAPAALFAGRLSYPIYVLHRATFTHFTHFGFLRGPKLWFVLMGAFAAILMTSYAAIRLYDEPVRKWLSSSAQRRAAETSFTAG
jgi:peptidoglycan/LPS O-acetylase OafA/YrhL